VNIKGGFNTGAFAHELKHAFQFETGKLSFGPGGKRGGDLFDLQDEVEAYARGSMFGWPSNPSLTQLKKDYPSISDRTTQRTLTTPYIEGLPITYHQEMINANYRTQKNRQPILNYYKDWKKD